MNNDEKSKQQKEYTACCQVDGIIKFRNYIDRILLHGRFMILVYFLLFWSQLGGKSVLIPFNDIQNNLPHRKFRFFHQVNYYQNKKKILRRQNGPDVPSKCFYLPNARVLIR